VAPHQEMKACSWAVQTFNTLKDYSCFAAVDVVRGLSNSVMDCFLGALHVTILVSGLTSKKRSAEILDRLVLLDLPYAMASIHFMVICAGSFVDLT
jgi:hypothetical protein